MIGRPFLRDVHTSLPDRSILAFWQEAGKQGRWFEKNPRFDRVFRERFLDLHMQIAARAHDDWIAGPEGGLALLILTDQFPRNAFRNTAHMYATDLLARHYARQALDARHMERIDPELRLFFCLPFAHSEDISDQDISVVLNRKLGEPWLGHAVGHREIIRRFGRFPHRNHLFGRTTTPEEEHYLKEGGFGG
ncbi:DUF924 family protein [Ochrobactrum quorumnocens]